MAFRKVLGNGWSLWEYLRIRQWEDGIKFLDVRTDYAFKKVFGSEKSKPQLISFLNALLEFPKGQRVEDLDIVNPYNIPILKG